MSQASGVIVTGANSGIGRACTEALLANGWHVIAACRDVERARVELSGAAGPNLEIRALDLASLASVRRFADGLRTQPAKAPLHALVCNAGLQYVDAPRRSEDGFELTYAVNHLGHYLLLHRLIPLLQTPARIAIVASGTHDPAQKTGVPVPRWRGARGLAEPDDEGITKVGTRTAGLSAYSTSKLCNVLTTYAFAERLTASHPELTINAYDPGLTPGTGLARSYPAPIRFAFEHVLGWALPLIRLWGHAQTVRQAGDNLARLVIDPDLEGVSGRYFAGTDDIRSSADSYDPEKQQDLFVTSAALVGLRPEEAAIPIV